MTSINQFSPRFISILLLFCFAGCNSHSPNATNHEQRPRIVNIVNFIRLLEPRIAEITEDVLYQTVVKQVQIMQQHHLPGTFLLQYDALMDERYQQLLKKLPPSFEVGAWWEIPQPLVEKAGLKWRGRYPWDWHAHVGFSTGYTPGEREQLADVYMQDFKKIFGYYPKSVASWFIDAHTLNYLYEKYKIVASANCKDQLGTDGYTLWGGYWNQAYYPSKINAYMPAQTQKNQTPVPIFRMLGSDPVRQYDDGGNGSNGQGVITLEPASQPGGGDSAWVHWYFKEFVEGQSMEYAYVQAGQENSFTWNAMAKGFEIQMPLIARLRNEGKVKVETLAASGEWFRNKYPVTPATSVTVNNDLNGSNKKTVWFNSRFYRFNLLWENNTLRFRDIHIFNENFPSIYTKERATSNECSFFTLPFVDGYRWGIAGKPAALQFRIISDGKAIPMEGGTPTINDDVPGKLRIEWPLKSLSGTLVMDADEKQIQLKVEGNKTADWFLDLSAGDTALLPFTKIAPHTVSCRFEGMDYQVKASKGNFSTSAGDAVIRIRPEMGTVILNFTQ
ncbi:hypothetical protein [Agriterribacter sp.]|uniref:hypothetical protein n=1 Tax=Agriterribacter sp. TaxID=2821509 RepID=UPI002C3CCDB6|nr:hypothetical protein [Agriterribacter sp.]HRP57601.1 hypothetical protein [Agriterribacter sp.]